MPWNSNQASTKLALDIAGIKRFVIFILQRHTHLIRIRIRESCRVNWPIIILLLIGNMVEIPTADGIRCVTRVQSMTSTVYAQEE